jgi:hypothetical protein
MLSRNIGQKILIGNNKTALLTKSIEAHDIMRLLKKGFVLVKQDSKFVTRSVYFNIKKSAILQFYDDVISISPNEKEE